LIEATLHAASGNRTHAARRLGLQRTYLLRLMRELRVTAPPPPERRRRAVENESGAAAEVSATATVPSARRVEADARPGVFMPRRA
jgi:hypothetical protein